ncbi:MAG: thiamine biosynthesis protein ThiS [Planctomycetota bacterium]|nr:MAG: thiamine biosynthesis protein ThiS [Planctomycetota bacterium]
MSATLKINGTEKTFDQGLPSTLTELLAQLEINAATVVAEINGDIVERKNFAQTELKDQMAIELIRFDGGG